MRLNLPSDELLTTTRSVRKRLDLQRPVEREIVRECVTIALQAPTGSNRQGWHWLLVDDRDTIAALADVYRRAAADYTGTGLRHVAADTDPAVARVEAVNASVAHLMEHLHEVPMMLVPMLEGRLDDLAVAQAAASWGSIIPAVWSFMLAARERGLACAWTTVHLVHERAAAEILAIPYERFTQAGLFPVAHSIGTNFSPAPRLGLEHVLHWNRFGDLDHGS